MTIDCSDIFSCTIYLAYDGQRIEHAVHTICAINWEEAKIEAMRLYTFLPNSSVSLTLHKYGQLFRRATIARL